MPSCSRKGTPCCRSTPYVTANNDDFLANTDVALQAVKENGTDYYDFIWRKMANIITGMRILCGIILIFCEPFSQWFYRIYILGGASDVLDGMVARYLGKETKLGAQLDTIADIVFTAVVILRTVQAFAVPLWLIFWVIGIAAVKCINMICGFVIHKRFISEHTAMNKLCGILLFALPLCIGRVPWQAAALLFVLTCTAATFAALQEGRYIRAGKEIR